MSTTITIKRRRVNRFPSHIRELEKQIIPFQRYLSNFYLRNIKKLAITQSLPIEFFQKMYEDKIETQTHAFIEQVYITRLYSVQDQMLKLVRTRRQPSRRYYKKIPKTKTQRSKSAAVPATAIDSQEDFRSYSLIGMDILDIENIKRITRTVTDKFFNSVGRLIGRQNTFDFNTITQTLKRRTPFDDHAAMKRIAVFGGYAALNAATLSKLHQIQIRRRSKSAAISLGGFSNRLKQFFLGPDTATDIAAATPVDTSTGGQGADYRAQVQYVTAADDRVCPRCRDLDGRMFYEDDLGKPELPDDMHPNCRCFYDLLPDYIYMEEEQPQSMMVELGPLDAGQIENFKNEARQKIQRYIDENIQRIQKVQRMNLENPVENMPSQWTQVYRDAMDRAFQDGNTELRRKYQNLLFSEIARLQNILQEVIHEFQP